MQFEIIEYKSNGHPDTLTDLVVEACATALDDYYLKTYRRVLHYNIDKAVFLAGNVEVHYGGGTIIKLPCFILGGQVSNLDGSRVVLKTTIVDTVRKYLPNLGRFRIEIRCNNVSRNLDDIARNEQVLCNDTSFGVGYWPFSDNERKVLALRDQFDEMVQKQEIPIGECYKIMLTPRGIVVSAPFYAQRIRNHEEYAAYKQQIEETLNVTFNPDFDSGFPYMTLSGSSIECGDDGQVGRGNRYNGLITPCRPMTIEAYSGKNNRNHIGKLYSKLAFEKAKQTYEATKKPTQVIMVGRIGTPLDTPEIYIEEQ